MYEVISESKNMAIVMNVYSADLAKIVAMGKRNGIRFVITGKTRIGMPYLPLTAVGEEADIMEFLWDIWNETQVTITREIAA